MNFIKKMFFLFPGLDKFKKRRIKQGPLKDLFYYGSYVDERYFNSFEPEVVNLIKRTIVRGNIYDIGAHFGFYSSLFAKIAENGKVYSFEPNPFCLEKLRETIRINGFNDLVEIFDFGLGEKDQDAEMEVLLDNLARSTCDQELKHNYKNQDDHLIKRIKIKIKALDNLGLPAPSLIKIDVEGLEARVIQGMLKTIEKYRPDLIIEIHGKNQESEQRKTSQVFNLLKDFNYYGFNIQNRIFFKDLNKMPSGGNVYFSTKKANF